ncbi:hypothetical protein [Streptomyces sp. NPDC007100]|uniref:hypothetical protein n=1 Tax=Streptomyces sp. NPDC007100 TaxID=3155602 RepID=UPI0033DAFDDF
MSLFRRTNADEPIDLNAPVDDEAARRAAAYVNAGKVRKANRVCAKTDNPRATAFAAFRYIDTEQE